MWIIACAISVYQFHWHTECFHVKYIVRLARSIDASFRFYFVSNLASLGSKYANHRILTDHCTAAAPFSSLWSQCSGSVTTNMRVFRCTISSHFLFATYRSDSWPISSILLSEYADHFVIRYLSTGSSEYFDLQHSVATLTDSSSSQMIHAEKQPPWNLKYKNMT